MKYLKLSVILHNSFLEEPLNAVFEKLGLENLMIENQNGKIVVSVFLPENSREGEKLIKEMNQFDEREYTIIETVVEDFWSAKLHGDFRPLESGRFLIVPHHLTQLAVPEDKIELRIIPAQAFGTGQHETTDLMMKLISAADMRGKRVLDAGCGTGILGIAAILTGAAYVRGMDIDPLALENTLENLEINGLCGKMVVEEGQLQDFVNENWDFVFANILHSKLIEMKELFREMASAETVFFFSGITVYQKDEFIKEFDFLKMEAFYSGEWVAFSGRVVA